MLVAKDTADLGNGVRVYRFKDAAQILCCFPQLLGNAFALHGVFQAI